MTREIKFRAWDKDKKQWLFGYELPNLGGFSLFGEVMMLGEWSSIPLDKLNDIEVMQFTGLLDKNGKEMYEGDIVRTDDHEIAKIEWDAPEFVAMYRGLGGYWNALSLPNNTEIIGNIYEHPNLLN